MIRAEKGLCCTPRLVSSRAAAPTTSLQPVYNQFTTSLQPVYNQFTTEGSPFAAAGRRRAVGRCAATSPGRYRQGQGDAMGGGGDARRRRSNNPRQRARVSPAAPLSSRVAFVRRQRTGLFAQTALARDFARGCCWCG
eukprot:8915160-Pyramimonas_sp.AAC.1